VCACVCVCVCAVYHVASAFAPGRCHPDVRWVVVLRVRGRLVTHLPGGQFAKGLVGCHREFPAPGAKQLPTHRLPASGKPQLSHPDKQYISLIAYH